MKVTKILCLFFAAVLLLSSVTVLTSSAASAYQTYTYSYDGDALYSPDAYTADEVVDGAAIGLEQSLSAPADLETDTDGNVYIADTGNNRIVCLNKHYELKFQLAGFRNDYGNPDALAAPQGVFVTEDTIWVADTGKSRIVAFDKVSGAFKKIIRQPESALFDDNAVYRPIALAVDAYNRLYVVSSTTYQGIIVMTAEGEFTQFVGTQTQQLSAWARLWRKFQTDEQRELSETIVSTEYNNITINEKGIIYVTTSTIDESTVAQQITGKVTDGTYSPVKMINATGAEIMRRNGFWVPYGEINYLERSLDSTKTVGVSMLVDVAVGPAKSWSVIDQKRSRVYTYDYDGNLLFAFGDTGYMLGNITQKGIAGVTYQGDVMLVLDKLAGSFTVFKRTEYGDLLIRALEAENNQEYNKAISLWQDVLKRNSNFDSAYIGIGQALFRSGYYEEALEYYKAAYDTKNYSNAFREMRTDFMAKYFLLIMVVIVAVIVGVSYFFKWAGKVNKRAAVSGGKKTFKEELLYAFHVIFHPFDGFWDLKHEKRGSVRAALAIDAITVAVFYYQAIGQGYISNPHGTYSSLWAQLMGVVVPLMLFVLANWCLTTLFEGEGSFKDIFMVCSYSLTPLPLLIIPSTIFTNFCLESELNVVSLLTTIGFIWVGMLIIFGTQVTHDYSGAKNVLMLVSTIIGMVSIMFIAVLFTTLISKMVAFVTNIVTEIQFRM